MAIFDIDGPQGTPLNYDVFISYATADNALYRGYIDNFRADLRDKLKSHPLLSDLRGREPEIFIDTESLARTGSIIQALEQAIDRTHFLVLMVSRNYLSSPWCFKELQFFRNRFGGKRDEAFKRTFILVLERDALPLHTHWPSEQFGTELPRYLEFFDDGRGRPMARGNDREIDEDYNDQLVDIAEEMAKLYHDLKSDKQGRANGAAGTHMTDPINGSALTSKRALLGVVTPDLSPARIRLSELLKAKGIDSELLEPADLKRSHRRDLEERIGPDMIYVQLVSYAPPVLDQLDDLGHLMIQRDVLRELAAQGPKEMVWCYPEQEDGVIAGSSAEAATEPVATFVTTTLSTEHACRDLRQVVARLSGNTGPRSRITKVYVESTAVDKDVSRELRRNLEKVWKRKYGPDQLPKFYAMPWGQGFRERLPDCRGVILLYGKKDEESLEAQVNLIDQTILALDHPPCQWVALAPPQQDQSADCFWDSFWFESNPDLEMVVDDIYRAMTENPSAAMTD